MRLPQSQNKNVNNIYIVGNPVCINSEQGGVKYWPERIMYCVDSLYPYHMTSACERTDPPSRLLPCWLPI
jgi:hypothetical protein